MIWNFIKMKSAFTFQYVKSVQKQPAEIGLYIFSGNNEDDKTFYIKIDRFISHKTISINQNPSARW